MSFSNSKKLKTISVLLVVLFIVSTMSVYAQEFTDVPDDFWAVEYITKVNELGIITGYNDATFRPDKNVSNLEAIVMISRLLELSEELANKAIEYNKDFLEEIDLPNWAEKGVAIALSSGIVSEGVMRNIVENGIYEDIEKIDACIYLVRVMNLEEEANNKTLVALSFIDAMMISAKSSAYVDVLIEKGIISRQGDNEGKFKPQSPVNRAIMAKMLSLAYDYIDQNDENKLTVSFEDDVNDTVNQDNNENNNNDATEDTEGTTENEQDTITHNISGTITGILKIEDTINVKIQKDNGEEKIYQAGSDAKTILDNEGIDILELEEGVIAEAKVTEDNNILSISAISIEEQYDGKVDSAVDSILPMIIIEVEENGEIQKLPFEAIDDVTVILDGEMVALSTLKKGDIVTIKIKNEKVVKAIAESKNKEYEGVLTKIDFNKMPIIIIEDDNGEEKEFTLCEDTKLIRNEKEIEFIDLKKGDVITVYTEYNKIIKVEALVVKTEKKGTINEIIIGSTSKLTIADELGEVTTYVISNDSDIKVEEKYKTIYDLRLGHEVNLQLENNVIVNLEAREVTQEFRHMGELIYINQASQLIMIKTDEGENILINTTVNTSFINVAGDKKTIDSLNFGDELLIVCTHDGVALIAENVIIMSESNKSIE